jgi:hypothetical protein
MTDAGADIFDDRRYLQEALLLPDGHNEDDVDTQLAAAARETGIEDPDLFLLLDLSTAIANMSLTSLSVHSCGTHPMSDPIDTDTSPTVPMGHRYSSSQFTFMSLPNSPIVRPSSARKSKRASAIFSIFRKEQRLVLWRLVRDPVSHHAHSACSSRSHHHHHHPRHFKHQSPKLECGHSLSKHAIRVHVQEALEKKDGAAPMCCNRPLPRHVLGMVLTAAEVDLVTDTVIPSPDELSWRDSGYSENGMSSIELPNVTDTQMLMSEPSAMQASPTHVINEFEAARLESALQSDTFQDLLKEQRNQFQRVSVFEANQRQTLLTNYRHSLDRLATQLKTTQLEREQQVIHIPRRHTMTLTNYSTCNKLNAWMIFSFEWNTTFMSLIVQKRRMSQQPSNTWKHIAQGRIPRTQKFHMR